MGATFISGVRKSSFSRTVLTRGRRLLKKAPMGVALKDAKPEKMEIDFAESHCCLIRTDYFRGNAPEFFLEDMHNSFTLEGRGFHSLFGHSAHDCQVPIFSFSAPRGSRSR